MERCPLRAAGDQAPTTDCFREGMLMLEPYMPVTDSFTRAADDLIYGMRETSENAGYCLNNIVHLWLSLRNVMCRILHQVAHGQRSCDESGQSCYHPSLTGYCTH
jgi:hypothetical protein